VGASPACGFPAGDGLDKRSSGSSWDGGNDDEERAASRGQRPQCALLTVGYHVADWPWGFEASFAPRDADMGPGPPMEIRKLKGPPQDSCQ
jgi:hypothetical protein